MNRKINSQIEQKRIETLLLYDETLKIAGHESIKNGSELEHARWMINEMLSDHKFAVNDGKLNRWLGFVQGVLYCNKIYTIEEMKDHNR